ncbi:MAG: YwqG family protein [Woeseiaceae bacterium]
MKFVVILVGIGAVLMLLLSRRQSTAESPSLPMPAEPMSSAKLEEWKSVLDQRALPAKRLRLTGQPATSTIASKIGGKPYWTDDLAYPASTKGEPLHFLAQVNFGEIDDRLEQFPDSGLLQFFIGADDLYGFNFEQPTAANANSRNYAVVFHEKPDVSRHIPTETPVPNEEDLLPFRGESGIRFESMMSKASPVDYRFQTLLPDTQEVNDVAFNQLYEYAIQAPSHQMGGYAVFTQVDPRESNDVTDDWQLLFQIDSEKVGGFDIMWGDVGIANFFIRTEDLEKRDFSRVWYNWDCH